MIDLDFETKSEISVKDVGAHRYAEDPSTDVVCLRWQIGDGPVGLWHPFGSGPKHIPKTLQHAIYVLKLPMRAHNKTFEECIWLHVMVKKYGWPRLPHVRTP